MKFAIQVSIEDLFSFDLATIDILKEDKQNAEDAFNGEMDYNDFDMKF